jgi:hypothetical protein
MSARLTPMAGEQIAGNPRDGRLSPWSSPAHRRVGMADHHPVTPPRRCRGHDPYPRNRSPSPEMPMAGTTSGSRLDGRGRKRRVMGGAVPQRLRQPHRPPVSAEDGPVAVHEVPERRLTAQNCLRAYPVHGPPFMGRPYNWARRSPGDGIPSRVRRTASVPIVIFHRPGSAVLPPG